MIQPYHHQTMQMTMTNWNSHSTSQRPRHSKSIKRKRSQNKSQLIRRQEKVNHWKIHLLTQWHYLTTTKKRGDLRKLASEPSVWRNGWEEVRMLELVTSETNSWWIKTKPGCFLASHVPSANNLASSYGLMQF